MNPWDLDPRPSLPQYRAIYRYITCAIHGFIAGGSRARRRSRGRGSSQPGTELPPADCRS